MVSPFAVTKIHFDFLVYFVLISDLKRFNTGVCCSLCVVDTGLTSHASYPE